MKRMLAAVLLLTGGAVSAAEFDASKVKYTETRVDVDKPGKGEKAKGEKKAKVKKPKVKGALLHKVTNLVLVLFLLSLAAQQLTA